VKQSHVRSGALVAALVLVAVACGGGAAPRDEDGAATTTAVDATAGGEMRGEHSHAAAVEAPGPMTVELTVEQDAKAGWNLFFATTGFTWAPEHASGEHVPGEGHAHLYVDGAKVARVYGGAFHLASLDPGARDVTIELNSNDHAPYAVDGLAVTDTVTVEVEGAEDVGPPDHVIEVTVEMDGSIAGPERVEVATGDSVLIRVSGHTMDRLHVHGYDRYAMLTADAPAEVSFVATTPGIFEVELEESATPLLELVVS
jgi:hypothetical protein